MDSSVPLTHHDPRDLGSICLIEKQNPDSFGSWIFLKKRTLRKGWSSASKIFKWTGLAKEKLKNKISLSYSKQRHVKGLLKSSSRFRRKVQAFLPRPSQYTRSAPLPGFFQELLQVRLKAEKGDVWRDCVNSLT